MNYAENKKAFFDYETLDKTEAGIVLSGAEVKSIRGGKVSIIGSQVILRGGEAYIVGATIQPYQPKNTPKGYEQDKTRKLLLSKSEIKKLEGKAGEKGLTIVPVSLYNKGTKIKLEIAVARGKKKYDKRETIKKRETEREIRRTFKR